MRAFLYGILLATILSINWSTPSIAQQVGLDNVITSPPTMDIGDTSFPYYVCRYKEDLMSLILSDIDAGRIVSSKNFNTLFHPTINRCISFSEVAPQYFEVVEIGEPIDHLGKIVRIYGLIHESDTTRNNIYYLMDFDK
jgi:hypothetical protein